MATSKTYNLQAKLLKRSEYGPDLYLASIAKVDLPVLYQVYTTNKSDIKQVGQARIQLVGALDELNLTQVCLIIDCSKITDPPSGSLWSITRAADGVNIYTDERLEHIVMILPAAPKARSGIQNIVKFALSAYRTVRFTFVGSQTEAVKILQQTLD